MKIIVFIGTRPEAIKMAPVVRALRAPVNAGALDVRVCATGQHREMLWQALEDFDLTPDVDLDVMTTNQGLGALSAQLMSVLDAFLAKEMPDWILVQGDTTTVMIASLCAFYHHIKVGHVEAGLRSFNKNSPFPEEVNRKIASITSDVHFAPTIGARDNLLREGVDPKSIYVTGNTIVDALMCMQKRSNLDAQLLPECRAALKQKKKIVLVTCHRRESFGEPLKNICRALLLISNQVPECHILYPVHRNPCVRETVFSLLSDNSNISLVDPLPYASFVAHMRASFCILSDSGGIQEEVATLNKPLFVLRDVTERPEGIEAGFAKLVGTSTDTIVQEVCTVFTNMGAYAAMTQVVNPYGDGLAAQRIKEVILNG